MQDEIIEPGPSERERQLDRVIGELRVENEALKEELAELRKSKLHDRLPSLKRRRSSSPSAADDGQSPKRPRTPAAASPPHDPPTAQRPVCSWWSKYGAGKHAKPCAGSLKIRTLRNGSEVQLCGAHTCINRKIQGCQIVTRHPQGKKCDSCSRSDDAKERKKMKMAEKYAARR